MTRSHLTVVIQAHKDVEQDLTDATHSLTRVPEILVAPFPEHLFSNHPPTEEQVHSVRQTIAAAERVLASIDLKLRHSPNDSGLLSSRIACQTFIDNHRKVLSPWRHLPEELLMEIFSKFLPHTNPLEVRLHPYSRGYFRRWMSIRRVCREWKDALHTVPKLFGYLPTLSFRIGSQSGVGHYQQLLQHIGWAYPEPLQFMVSNIFSAEEGLKALPELIALTDNWEIVHFDNSYSLLLSLTGLKFPNLRKLTLELWWLESDDVAHGDPLSVFEHAPKLEHLLAGSSCIIGARAKFPWKQLKFYADILGDAVGGALPTVVAQCTELEHLKVRQRERIPVDKVNLRALKSLDIYYGGSILFPEHIIHQLTLLRLETLRIALPDIIESSFAFRSVTSLVSRSGCGNHLRHISLLIGPQLSKGELTNLLHDTPQLIRLDIKYPPIEDALSLAVLPDRPTLVRQLECLRIHTNINPGDEAVYRTIGQTRCEAVPSVRCQPPVRRLKELRVVVPYDAKQGFIVRG
ncbi:hypothetical protein CC1G_02348 [Coprinopsis cinerea okayama7|uniref:F-box domain-containing protein n=1 Tax=Coprinopsis cinerea (strain Okayama-7 / 130 / ATCC MYA-4618 / FGSC 9003) TaxID=240176 RepID=A8N7U1_COPC7|nr:hypothetical protein CC1G_02348 [Coprinopsis cinerea okayama7\|eukprot:XP_001830897.2 hypothetical protein CC1G_02348 [Coprinopsis cinerea okayama7\